MLGTFFLLRNDLGDNRGTKIKREIPQLLIFNELLDFTVPRTGIKPCFYEKSSETNITINQRVSGVGVFSYLQKYAYVLQKVYTLFIPE